MPDHSPAIAAVALARSFGETYGFLGPNGAGKSTVGGTRAQMARKRGDVGRQVAIGYDGRHRWCIEYSAHFERECAPVAQRIRAADFGPCPPTL